MSNVEEITILLGTCKNLHSSRGDGFAFTVFAQVALGKTLLGESTRFDCKAEESSCQIDLEVKHSLKVSDPLSYDELARSPLLVSVHELLPKDKKSKEEKTQLLGIANIDLLPLLQGHTSVEKNLKLSALNRVLPPAEDSPEIDVTVSVLKPLLAQEEISKSNIISLRVKGLYSLPEGWNSNQGSTFTVATSRPLQPGDDITSNPLTITGGEIKTAGDIDSPQKMGYWKWAELNPTTSGLASLTSNIMEVNAVEDESGQLTSPESIAFRRTVESRKPRIIWNSELRAYFPPSSNSSFLSHLSRAPIWPIEVIRVTSSTGKGKGKDEEITLSHHGVAYVDLSSLLHPGNTHIFGAYPIDGMDEMDLADKTCEGHTKSIMDLVHRASGSAGNPLKRALANKRPSTPLKASVLSLATAGDATTETSAAIKVETSIYVEAKSYIFLEIQLSHPLVPKRPASVISEKISEYIPPRPAIPRRLGGVERAIFEFHGATADVAGLLLADYKLQFGSLLEEKGLLPNTNEDFEERKKQLLYTLNTSGRYHAYKEHMKKSVVSLVREKFLNEANTKTEEETQAFLSRLYTYLIDEMHNALGKVFSLEDSPPTPPTIVDCDMLREYAREAELMLELEKADYYHKELLSREEHIALHWYDYGIYYLLKGDTEHSEQCLKVAVSLDQQFVPALLLYGMCCSLEEKFVEASEMMELATTIDSDNIIAWTMRGLCYELSNNTLYRDMCYKTANKLSSSDEDKTYIAPAPSSKQKQQTKEQLGESEETTSQKSTIPTQEIQGTVEKQSSDVPPPPPPADTVLSDPSAKQVTTEEELHSMESKQMSDEETSEKEINQNSSKLSEQSSPFLQTAAYLLDVYAIKYAEMCLAHERLLHTKQQPTAKDDSEQNEDSEDIEKEENILSVDYHIAVARLYLIQTQYNKADFHLSWAVKEDILNPNAWALLGHCHYLLENLAKAKDCYERVVEYVKHPVHVNIVLLRLADVYMKNKEYTKAKKVYLRACRKAPSNTTWRGVGIACYMLKSYSEAEDALSEANILNNLDPTTWAYLALVCHHTNRIQEATQALNFAIKTGLTDTSLIQQLQNVLN